MYKSYCFQPFGQKFRFFRNIDQVLSKYRLIVLTNTQPRGAKFNTQDPNTF